MTVYRADIIFRNPRSDLDRVTATVPPGPGEDGWTHRTLRHELDGGRRSFRRDIILVNAHPVHCKTCACTDDLAQFVIEVKADGSLTGDPEAFDLVSEADLVWATDEARRMVADAATHPGYAAAFLAR